jgi:hypothetical protein
MGSVMFVQGRSHSSCPMPFEVGFLVSQINHSVRGSTDIDAGRGALAHSDGCGLALCSALSATGGPGAKTRVGEAMLCRRIQG